MLQKHLVNPVNAAIDVGSNTIHLVVARTTPHDLDMLADEVELVRIGESVTASGEISQEKMQSALVLLQHYKAVAEQHQAEHVLVVATEAIRKARNSDTFIEAVKRETGLQIEIVTGDVEATLTFYGATNEVAHRLETPALLAVMDLGGGSTEVVLAENMRICWQNSLPVGSGWLHDRYLPTDPPTSSELSAAQTLLANVVQDIQLERQPDLLIVTGGSANSLLYLARQAFLLDQTGDRLTYEQLLRCEGLLCALPAQEVAHRFGQEEGRARILPAGALIIRQMMQHLNVQEIMVSPHGIREGTLLAYARYGECWLDSIQAEAEAASKASRKREQDARHAQDEPFIEFARQVLLERISKFVEWRDAVIKHDDIEAVHKMRVASRRLRAALDAFEPCGKPKKRKQVRRQIKNMADALGRARDTDVMLQGLDEQLESAASDERPGIEWLMQRLMTYRRQKQANLDELLGALGEERFSKQVEASLPRGGSPHGQS